MADPVSASGAYLADSLKIFLLPVSTIGKAAQRQLSPVGAVLVLLLMAAVAGVLQFIIGQIPGGLSEPPGIFSILQQVAAYILFFLIALGLLFALIVIVGGQPGFMRLFAAKLALSSAVVGAFLVGIIGKLIIGLLFLGAKGGVGGGLIVLGEQFGLLATGLILAVYTIIVARSGGKISWPKALIAAVLHLLLMIAIITAYDVVMPQNDLFNILNKQ